MEDRSLTGDLLIRQQSVANFLLLAGLQQPGDAFTYKSVPLILGWRWQWPEF